MPKYGEKFLTEEDQARLEKELSRWESDADYAFEWSDRMTKKAALVLEAVIDNASGSNAANHILSAVDKLTRLAQVLAELNHDRVTHRMEETAAAAAHQKQLDALEAKLAEKGKPPEVLVAAKKKRQKTDSDSKLG